MHTVLDDLALGHLDELKVGTAFDRPTSGARPIRAYGDASPTECVIPESREPNGVSAVEGDAGEVHLASLAALC